LNRFRGLQAIGGSGQLPAAKALPDAVANELQ
jgi:hypothetical protein